MSFFINDSPLERGCPLSLWRKGRIPASQDSAQERDSKERTKRGVTITEHTNSSAPTERILIMTIGHSPLIVPKPPLRTVGLKPRVLCCVLCNPRAKARGNGRRGHLLSGFTCRIVMLSGVEPYKQFRSSGADGIRKTQVGVVPWSNTFPSVGWHAREGEGNRRGVFINTEMTPMEREQIKEVS